MNFQQIVKEIRKKVGMSQEQIAEKIGVSRQALIREFFYTGNKMLLNIWVYYYYKFL